MRQQNAQNPIEYQAVKLHDEVSSYILYGKLSHAAEIGIVLIEHIMLELSPSFPRFIHLP